MKPLLPIALLVLALPAAAGLHPDMVLRDADGVPVVTSGEPVSPMQSCGANCHDTAWIEEHSAHAWLGLDEAPRATPGRSFDTGPGPLRRWDPITYDRVAFEGDFTLGIADWLRRHGDRHVGGGFAAVDPSGTSLLEDAPRPDAWTKTRREDGTVGTWDWRASGDAELNCFVCHVDRPANEARIEALREGRFGDAATATLGDTRLVTPDDDGWTWDDARFDEKGAVTPDALGLTRATSTHCGQCHGTVVDRVDEAFWFAPDARRRGTETTGAIFAPGRIARSGMNVAGRDDRAHAWDVHAERLVGCTDCHGALNNPFRQAGAVDRPEHLVFDARREDPSAYLRRPRHDFVKGTSAQGTVRDALDGDGVDCRRCHDATKGHDWLPYAGRHFEALECSACHVPRVLGAARQSTDWTVLTDDRGPRVVHRGAHGDPASPSTLLEGHVPALLPRTDATGATRLAPHNLISTWYWFDVDRDRPVTREQLEAAWFDGDAVHADVLQALDATGNGRIDPSEFALLMPHQVEAVAARLRAVGVRSPEIRAETQAYAIGHGVVGRQGATRDCATCHGTESRLTAPVTLADLAPGDVLPTVVGDVDLAGTVNTSVCGHVELHPDPELASVYVFGTSRRRGVDAIGLGALALVFGGVLLHGGLRVVLWSIRRQRRVPELEPRTEGAS